MKDTDFQISIRSKIPEFRGQSLYRNRDMHIIYLRRVSVYCMLKYNFTKLTNFEIYLDRQIGKRFLFFIVIVDINISLRRHALRPNADHCYNGISFRDMSCRSSLDLWTYMDIKVKSVLTRGKACDVICLY